jgi:enterochelin esterase family protein
MRTFRDSLLNKGYDFSWQERHEGHSWGLWRATTDFILQNFFPLVTGVEEKKELPVQIQLYQNYPNPFNPSTSIKYSLPQASQVTLAVYTTIGQLVKLLVDEKQEAGYHEVTFDGSGLSSGMYFYRLRDGEIIQTKKLLLLK